MNTDPRRSIHALMDPTFQLYPFDIVQYNALCKYCRDLSAAVMALPDSQLHTESIEALQSSA
jgi:hypothetical protein